ncbi:MAG: hypothetical protein ACR2MX_05375 [Cyclobacteriaceae bacterium]
MKRTKYSLYYLASYLTMGGLGLVFAPQFFLKLLGSNQDYSTEMPQLAGLLMIALGIFVMRVIQKDLKEIYPATLIARVVICAGLVYLYSNSCNPLFLVLLIIVGLGFVITSVSYFLDSRNQHKL